MEKFNLVSYFGGGIVRRFQAADYAAAIAHAEQMEWDLDDCHVQSAEDTQKDREQLSERYWVLNG